MKQSDMDDFYSYDQAREYIKKDLESRSDRSLSEEEIDVVMKAFDKFMHGQTVGIKSTGETALYPWDVEKFCRWYWRMTRGEI